MFFGLGCLGGWGLPAFWQAAEVEAVLVYPTRPQLAAVGKFFSILLYISHSRNPLQKGRRKKSSPPHKTRYLAQDAISGIRGDKSGIRGDKSGIRGDKSGIRGDKSGIRGDKSRLYKRLHRCGLGPIYKFA
jgi:hypothetical protein